MTHNLVDEACDKTGTDAKVMYFGKYYKKINLPEIGLEKIDEDLLNRKMKYQNFTQARKRQLINCITCFRMKTGQRGSKKKIYK